MHLYISTKNSSNTQEMSIRTEWSAHGALLAIGLTPFSNNDKRYIQKYST